ncbi:MAG: GNAT family N-acetyltransferase [Alistipes sp.]|nr:GNAT family N-acetyltransferase [Alistipes sp.]
METITIRRAGYEDCPRLLELVRELALYEKAPEKVTVTLDEFSYAGFGEGKVWDAMVAETDGRIIGFALWYIRFSTWRGKRIYLEDLYVEQQYRGKSVGRKLFDALIAETRKQGIRGMVWQALDWNRPALEFYSKYGAEFDGGWINCSLEFGDGEQE